MWASGAEGKTGRNAVSHLFRERHRTGPALSHHDRDLPRHGSALQIDAVRADHRVTGPGEDERHRARVRFEIRMAVATPLFVEHADLGSEVRDPHLRVRRPSAGGAAPGHDPEVERCPSDHRIGSRPGIGPPSGAMSITPGTRSHAYSPRIGRSHAARAPEARRRRTATAPRVMPHLDRKAEESAPCTSPTTQRRGICRRHDAPGGPDRAAAL